MRGMLALLSPNEEVALRRVALGFSHGVVSDHIRRLKDLHLIEADKTSWRLTALGQQRFASLPRAVKLVETLHGVGGVRQPSAEMGAGIVGLTYE